MFIPRGTTVHENLATSYVLVEALIADLCEGGFSGVVKVTLAEIEANIIIVDGSVGAVVERRNNAENATYDRSSVPRIAEQARLERGVVSIRSYSVETAQAIAGRLNAQSLYARLSIEFTDLETMLQKLAREPDREWFVDINTDARISALVHIHDRSFHVIASKPGHEDEWHSPQSADDAARKELFAECKRAAGTFDVYFKDPLSSGRSVELEGETFASDSFASDSNAIATTPSIDELVAGPVTQPSSWGAREAAAATSPVPQVVSELSLVGEEFPLVSDAVSEAAGEAASEYDSMTELKRLMGEIAGTIEGAAQAVDRRDGFAMCLRAGQLKIAERYPFLDPFASEFEYLAGEIVFVGDVTAEQFVAGLTEALGLAVESLAESNAYGGRFRAYVKEDLGKLLARNRTQLESYGLDRTIGEIAHL